MGISTWRSQRTPAAAISIIGRIVLRGKAEEQVFMLTMETEATTAFHTFNRLS